MSEVELVELGVIDEPPDDMSLDMIVNELVELGVIDEPPDDMSLDDV